MFTVTPTLEMYSPVNDIKRSISISILFTTSCTGEQSLCVFVDEIDKMPTKDQASLLNLMETGIVSETKYGKTGSAQIIIVNDDRSGQQIG